jgi:hypothetical protein
MILVAFGFLWFLLFSLERRNELPSCLKQRLSIGQENSTAPPVSFGDLHLNPLNTQQSNLFRFL